MHPALDSGDDAVGVSGTYEGLFGVGIRAAEAAAAQLLSLEILSSEMDGPSQGGGRGREEDCYLRQWR